MKKIHCFVILLLIAGLNAMGQVTPTASFMVEGIKVIYKPTLKDIVNVSVYFRGGVNNYSPGNAGIEKLAIDGAVECGNAKYNKNSFKDKCDAFDIRVTGSTVADYSRISLNCISKYFADGWDLLSSSVVTPAYEADAFGKMKEKAVVTLRQSNSNPDSRLEAASLRSAFVGTPYAIDPDGTEASLSAQTVQDAKAYYFKTLLDKSRMFIVVVGNISKEEISAKISAAFASIPSTGYNPPAPAPPPFLENKVNVEERSLSTNYIEGIMSAPAYTSPDYVPFLLAFSELHGILFTEIRTRRNLSYAPDANVEAALLPWSRVYVSTTSPKESVEIIVGAIKYLKKMGVNEKYLTQIKALYVTSSYRRAESTDAIALNLGKAEILGGWEIAEQMVDHIQSATRDAMSNALNKYLNGINWTYLGDKQKASETMGAFYRSVNE